MNRSRLARVDVPVVGSIAASHPTRTASYRVLASSRDLKIEQKAVVHTMHRAHVALVVDIIREHNEAERQTADQQISHSGVSDENVHEAA
jgi:hypothetical protein